MLEQICSRCGENGLNCKCEMFHPNVNTMIINETLFVLSKQEVQALHDYFYHRAGWISPEFDSIVNDIIKRIDKWLKLSSLRD